MDGFIVLNVYRAPSGQWSGRLFDGEIEIGGVAGCSSPGEVEEAAIEAGFDFNSVEIMN